MFKECDVFMKTKESQDIKLPARNISYVLASMLYVCVEENVKVLVKERKKKNDTKAKRNI